MPNRLPNLFIIGATKCGTTSLFTYLNMHPDFRGSTIKETNYFLPRDFDEKKVNLIEYSKYFKNAGDERYIFEATAVYINGKRRLATYFRDNFPGCKIIIMLRDPYDRARSYFNFFKDLVQLPKEMTFSEYLDACEREMAIAPVPPNGTYHALIRPYSEIVPDWMDVFGDDLWIGFFEDLKADSGALTDSVCAWLGVPPATQSGVVFSIENPTMIPVNASLHKLSRRLADSVEPFLRANPAIKRRLRSIYHRLNKVKEPPPPLSEAERARLAAYFEPSNAALREAFARWRPAQPLPAWLSRPAPAT